MTFDLITLRALAEEIESHLRGEPIRRVDSGPRDLGLPCGQAGMLQFVLGANGYLCLQEDVPTRQEGGDPQLGERYLRGAIVEQLMVEERDRIVRVRLSRADRDGKPTYGQLVCELIHPHCQAHLIREAGGEILAQWWDAGIKGRRPRLTIGESYRLPADRGQLDAGDGGATALAQQLLAVGGAVEPALARGLVGLDRNAANELAHRAGCSGCAADSISPATAIRLWDEYCRLAGVGGRCFVWPIPGVEQLSVIEPTHQPEYGHRDSISRAIRECAQLLSPTAAPGNNIRAARRMLNGARKKMRKRLEAFRADLDEATDAEAMERCGTVLMANLRSVPAGAARVELPDVYAGDPTARVAIDLDPRKSAAKNGEYYLKRANKLRRRGQTLPTRLRAAEVAAHQIEEYVAQLESGLEIDVEGVQHWLAGLDLVRPAPPAGRRRDDTPHPRTYKTSMGWTVLAGRNNRENDQLTHRSAAPNDIWFHAHGYAGAHVVLRRDDRREEPGARNLEEAAAVAAFWSKGKTAKKVPVIYTTVKYVSKPRGGAPGQAVVRREKTLIVEPRLPAGNG